MQAGRQMILGVSGSIAAYKSAELCRLLVQDAWDVHVIMTRAATEFVGEATFRTLSRNPVAVEMFGERSDWSPAHIEWADSATLLLIAPCTANVIAKLANGLADDMLTSTALASKARLVIAPAMNGKMWEHPATIANVDTLKERGAVFVDMGAGELACGYEGLGKMAEPESILQRVKELG